MVRVWVQRPWWRRMLALWWKVESVCCLWARPMEFRSAYQCGWCGRVLAYGEWVEPIVLESLGAAITRFKREIKKAGLSTRRFAKALHAIGGLPLDKSAADQPDPDRDFGLEP